MKYILILACALVGAFDILNAIHTFKDGHYFLSGFWVMLTIWAATNMVDVVLRCPV